VIFELQPDYYTASALAYVEEQKENLEEAIERNKESIKLKTEYLYPYYNLGHVYMTQEKYEDAIDILKQGRELAIDLDVHFPLLQNNLGYSYSQLKNYDEAIEMFSEAILLDETLTEAWYNRSLAHEYLGNISAYRADLGKVHELKPGYKDVKERRSRLAA